MSVRVRKKKEPSCAICWIDPQTGLAGSNETTRLCRDCRKDPANADWIEVTEEPPQLAPRPATSIDAAIRAAVRDVVREELRMVLREEIARIHRPATASGVDGGYLSVPEAAALIRVHPATIRGWIREGRLPQHRAGRHYRVKRMELQAFAAALSTSEVDLDALASRLSAA